MNKKPPTETQAAMIVVRWPPEGGDAIGDDGGRDL